MYLYGEKKFALNTNLMPTVNSICKYRDRKLLANVTNIFFFFAFATKIICNKCKIFIIYADLFAMYNINSKQI